MKLLLASALEYSIGSKRMFKNYRSSGNKKGQRFL